MTELRLCQVGPCGRPAKARWMCRSHYTTWVTRGRPAMEGLAGQRMDVSSTRQYAQPKQCSEDGCTTLARGHGLCSKHLRRRQRHGEPVTAEQTCAHDGHTWRTNGPGRPSPYCPEHRP